MDSDFMNNLVGMMKNGNIPNDIKNLMNNMKNSNQNDNSNNNNCNNNNINNNNSNNDDSSNSNSVNSNNINPDMLKNIMNMFSNSRANPTTDTNASDNSNNINFSNNFTNFDNSNNSENSNSSIPNIDINMLFKMKSIMDKMNTNKSDPRSNLLLSLKPYLKESRKNKVEQYIQFFNMTKVIDAFNKNGGENSK